MLRHIILWKLKDTVEDKEGTKAKVKALLEALVGAVSYTHLTLPTIAIV